MFYNIKFICCHILRRFSNISGGVQGSVCKDTEWLATAPLGSVIKPLGKFRGYSLHIPKDHYADHVSVPSITLPY